MQVSLAESLAGRYYAGTTRAALRWANSKSEKIWTVEWILAKFNTKVPWSI